MISFYILFIMSILTIFYYGSYRCNNPTYKDILEKKIGIYELDGWSVSHFIFYLIIGYNFPQKKYLIIAFCFGLAWEIFEHMYGKHRPGWLGGYGGECDLSTDRLEGNWWYGKYSDIILNLLGLYIGYYLYKTKLIKKIFKIKKKFK